jgi:hypothetical protein
LIARSIVRLPPDADPYDEFEVYLNGVLQQPDIDYVQQGRELIFDRPLRKDHITGWRWLLGAWGVGTYRQDDTIDIRYHANGEIRLKHGAGITLVGEPGGDGHDTGPL